VAAEAAAAVQRARLGHEAVLHTTMGDVWIKLLPSLAPKAVENFCGHARSGYFNGLLFHRVIPEFMVQT
jgi:peptidylprolyl isomerase domain and WD repeat-containing protein 1